MDINQFMINVWWQDCSPQITVLVCSLVLVGESIIMIKTLESSISGIGRAIREYMWEVNCGMLSIVNEFCCNI